MIKKGENAHIWQVLNTREHWHLAKYDHRRTLTFDNIWTTKNTDNWQDMNTIEHIYFKEKTNSKEQWHLTRYETRITLNLTRNDHQRTWHLAWYDHRRTLTFNQIWLLKNTGIKQGMITEEHWLVDSVMFGKVTYSGPLRRLSDFQRTVVKGMFPGRRGRH